MSVPNQVAKRTLRRGFALPAAIIALVLLSALVTGALFVATEELRAGRTDVATERTLVAAEWGLERAIAEWDARHNTALDVGSSTTITDTLLSTGERVRVTATRVQRGAFWVTSHGKSMEDGPAPPARHTVAASLRLIGPAFPPLAALTVVGRVTIGDGARVDGFDAAPESVSAGLCAEDTGSVAGVAISDSLLACGATCSGSAPPGVTGMPPVQVAPVIASDSTSSATGIIRDQLIRRATIILDEGTVAPRPSTSGAECNRADPLNWGDPDAGGVCRNHLPVIWIRGSAVLAAGSVGQGVLVVDGDLRLDPGAGFVGVVIVGDDIVVSGEGAEIVGSASAGDGDATDGSFVTDGGTVRFSACAVRRATLGASRLARTPVRWWSELR